LLTSCCCTASCRCHGTSPGRRSRYGPTSHKAKKKKEDSTSAGFLLEYTIKYHTQKKPIILAAARGRRSRRES
jgi:hypothetical protein